MTAQTIARPMASDNLQFQDVLTAQCRAIEDVFSGVDFACLRGRYRGDMKIFGISTDSRKVVNRSLFVAIKGQHADGHRYLKQAVQAGAVVLVVSQQYRYDEKYLPAQVVVLAVADTQQILATLAANFYQNPAAQLRIWGVTGTNGKTTVSYLIEHVLKALDKRVGVVGTIEYRYPGPDQQEITIPAPLTTPDPVLLHAILKKMVDNRVSHVIMEVSSHALEQNRLGPIIFSQALFTNLSQDHLDYHRSMEDYFKAKCRMFSEHCNSNSQAIIYQPADHDTEQFNWAKRLGVFCRSLPVPVITCGAAADAQIKLVRSAGDRNGLDLEFLDAASNHRRLSSPLVGAFNAENLLLAYTALAQMEVDSAGLCSILRSAHGAPGRLEVVNFHQLTDKLPAAYVDYAHTPDALEKVLQTLKKLPHQTLFCVIGCGGDRDRSKRPLMAEIAALYSEVVIITDDNPRTEEPAQIRKDMLAGLRPDTITRHSPAWLFTRSPEVRGVVEIGDRKQAIEHAVRAATSGDMVLIAGKGHEQYQLIGQEKKFFADRMAACQGSIAWDEKTISAALGLPFSGRCGPRTFTEIATDTRKINQAAVFIALKGLHFNGHDFLEMAVEQGAAGLIVSEQGAKKYPGTVVFTVPDTEKSLGDLARWRRAALKQMTNPVVVGITGSCGKTTVKEMTASIMQHQWPDRDHHPAPRVLKTQGNFNNLIGLPLTLLPASVAQRALILEMGMNQFGEIERLTEIADPDIACITNIACAHLEGVGSIEGVARAKGELFQATGEQSIHAVNLDDPRVVEVAQLHAKPMVRYGVSAQARAANPDVWATEIAVDQAGLIRFRLHVGSDDRLIQINTPGLHHCLNSCAAAAIAMAAGIDIDTIAHGLEQFQPVANRMAQLHTPAGLYLLNDTYNASPVSMVSAIRTLATIAARKRVAILGDMLELGEASDQLHVEIGRAVAESNLDLLAVMGNFSESIKRGALEAGMTNKQVISFAEKQQVIDWVKALLHSGQLQRNDWLLLKASRGLALDTVVDDLLQQC